MGLALDHHRFFFNHRLRPHFWLDPWAHFKYSQLWDRPGEILESIEDRDRVRPYFNSSPNGEATYCPYGPPYRDPVKQSANKVKTPTQPLSEFQKLLNKARAARKPLPNKPPKPLPDPPVWAKQYSMFYLPRPWWGWFNVVPVKQRPVDPVPFFVLCLVTTGLGAGLLWGAARQISPTEAPPQ
jgi:hypothetical protein